MRNRQFRPLRPRGHGRAVVNGVRYSGQPARRKGQYIDPSKFVNSAVEPTTEEKYVAEHKFSDFGFLPALEATVARRGYEHPTPIQDGAIRPAMEGRDIIGLANTGTGKTAAFVLPIIQRLKKNPNIGTVLVIAPTRELAVQIEEEFFAFAEGLHLYSTLCLGGMDIARQIRNLSRRPHVVVGTPGRLKDLYNQGALKLDRVGILVLDEADRMLDMGFIKDIRYLISKIPTHRQTMCFSATMPPEIKQLMIEILKDPVTISVRTRETADHVEQNVIKAGSKEEKFTILVNMLNTPGFEKVLIFGQAKWSVQRLAESLTRKGIVAEAIHGNKSQPQRQRALNAFKEGRVRVLVATDVAARGLDIPLVSHVINFDQPGTYDDYIHRIGRTGRAGNRGQALTFVA